MSKVLSTLCSWIYREYDRDSTSDGLLSCQVCSVADPQVLSLSTIALPARHGGAEEVNFNSLTRGQRCDNPLIASLAKDVDLCGRTGTLGCVQSGRTVGAVNHGNV